MEMPFGKYKGDRLETLPDDYLAWLLSINLKPWLRKAVEAEVESRAEPPATTECEITEELIREWSRPLILKYHPDRGGSHLAMVAINDAVESLRKLVAMVDVR